MLVPKISTKALKTPWINLNKIKRLRVCTNPIKKNVKTQIIIENKNKFLILFGKIGNIGIREHKRYPKKFDDD